MRLTDATLAVLSDYAALVGAQGEVVRTQLTTAVCPKAPPGAEPYANDIQGYVQWGVLILFAIGGVVAIGAVVAGRVFSMPHASKVGMISAVVVFIAAIGYMVVPAMIGGVVGRGCL